MERKSSALRKLSVLLLAITMTAAFSGMNTVASYAASAKPTKISVASKLNMNTAYTSKLKVKVTPAKAKSALKYKSSKPSVVSVSKSGKLTGKKTGKATVTVYAKGAKGKTLKKKVLVNVGICNSTTTADVMKYASDKSSHTILIDARSAEAYSGWAIDGAKRGGHLNNAINFSADWIDANYIPNKKGMPEPENKTTKDFLNREISANKMTRSNSYIVYDTNGKDAKKVAKYLIDKKGFRSVCTYNASKLVAKSNTKLTSDKNYDMYVPAVAVKNLSDNITKGTALNATSKKLLGDSKNIVILHVEYASDGKYTDDGYKADNEIDWSNTSYAKTGHVPGAIAASTDDFEPEEPTNHKGSTAYRLRHIGDDIDDAKLISLVERYGITKDSLVIVTNPDSSLAGARIAVILKYLGVDNTRIMTGHLQKWQKAGYSLETKINTATKSDFGATKALNPEWIDTVDEFEAGLKDTANFQGVDSRTKAEWDGLSSGYGYHDLAGRIPGTVFCEPGVNWNSSVYYYENPDYTMRSSSEIKAFWKKAGVDMSKHVSFFCGSGWRVSVSLWDARVMGYENTSIYSDGWQVWSNSGRSYIDKDGNSVHFDEKTGKVVKDAA